MKKVSVLLVICIVLSLSFGSLAATTDLDMQLQNNIVPNPSPLSFSSQAEKITAQNQVVATKTAERLYQRFDTSRGFPSEFAGMYFDGQKICVRLTDLSQSVTQQFLNSVSKAEDIRFELVKYSFAELESMMNAAKLDLAQHFEVTGAFLDEGNNSCIIGILPSEYDNAQFYFDGLEQYYGDPIDLVPMQREVACATLIGGSAASTTQAGFTLGICGSYNGYDAVLTCGHGQTEGLMAYLGTSPSGSSRRIGSVVKVQLEEGEPGDYGVIRAQYNSPVLTNQVRISSSETASIVGTVSRPSYGTTLYTYGKKSQFAEIRVFNANTNTEPSGITVTNQVRCKVISGTVQPGDSGAPVFMVDADSGGYLFVGVMSTIQQASTTLYCSFTPMANVSGFTVRTSA